MNEEVLYAVKNGVAWLTLNRPERLNATTPLMFEQLRNSVRAADADHNVRVAVITGAGRGFCAGGDMGRLKGIAARGEVEGATAQRAPDPDGHSFLASFSKPTIACINGAAAGIGLVLALQCDMRWVANDATLVTSFSRRGLIAEHGAAFLLERLVGPAVAADLLFSARKVSGAEAAALGMVNHAVPSESLLATVRTYAEMLASEVSPRSMAVIKRQIYAAQRQTLAEAMKLASQEMTLSFNTDDFREGIAHFVEGRPARFTGT